MPDFVYYNCLDMVYFYLILIAKVAFHFKKPLTSDISFKDLQVVKVPIIEYFTYKHLNYWFDLTLHGNHKFYSNWYTHYTGDYCTLVQYVHLELKEEVRFHLIWNLNLRPITLKVCIVKIPNIGHLPTKFEAVQLSWLKGMFIA